MRFLTKAVPFLAPFLAITAGIWQTIDGVFEGYSPQADTPWFRIRAVDGGTFDVESDREDVLNLFRESFTAVTELPDS